MRGSARIIALLAAILGFSAVVLAALGGHAVNMNDSPDLQRIWQTASVIHLFHAAALLGLAALLAITRSRPLFWGSCLISAGVVIFCASLYLRVVTDTTLTGSAPAGGLLMMSGWLLAMLGFVRKS